MEAAAFWARGGTSDLEAEEDLKAFGFDSAQITEILGDRESGVFEVFPENWIAVITFLACATQWRYHQAGQPFGIEYPALESVMRMNGVTDQADTFARVQVMEREAATIFQRR